MNNVGVREKLKVMGIRLIEFSTYLSISRPTLYKYLELYENEEFDKIDKRTYDLFNYIEVTRGLTKPILMDHLYNTFMISNDDENIIQKVKSLLSNMTDTNIDKINILKMLLESIDTTDFIERVNKYYGA